MGKRICRNMLAGLLAGATMVGVGVVPARSQGLVLPPLAEVPRAQPTLPAPKKAEENNAAPRDEKKADPLPMPRKVEEAPGYDLKGLEKLMDRANPRLAQAALAIEAAAGRALQAGLYPNPVVSLSNDEIADRTGPIGIITAPMISQEIVTAGKLDLSRAAANRQVDQAALELIALRFERLAMIRSAYYKVVTLQRRLEILEQLSQIAEESLRTSERLVKAGQAARLDQVQLEVEVERFRADREATVRELEPAFQQLAAVVGVSNLPYKRLAGSLDEMIPPYELLPARDFVVRAHPDILWAKKGIERAQLQLERARVEPIPNVTVGAGYVYQGQNKSNDFSVGLSLPVPTWNQNQGNIAALRAELGQAIQQVGRTENELSDRLGKAFEVYASALRRAELYRTNILPRAQESYRLAIKAYQTGQYDYLRVLEAQRVFSQADLEYVRSRGEAWRAAADLSGLLLEEQWPFCPPRPGVAAPAPAPASSAAPAPEPKKP